MLAHSFADSACGLTDIDVTSSRGYVEEKNGLSRGRMTSGDLPLTHTHTHMHNCNFILINDIIVEVHFNL